METIPSRNVTTHSQFYYQRYVKFIEFCKTSPKEGYTERHHIVPKSLGGEDNEQNLVRLTAREHFIAHWMLWKAYRNVQMAMAFNFMRQSPSSNSERYINSKTYKLLKEQISKVLSESLSGENHPFYGKRHSIKTKEKIAKTLTGVKRSRDSVEKQFASRARNNCKPPMLGKKHSDKFKTEHSKRMSGSNNPMFGVKRFWVNDGVNNYLVYEVQEGMTRGRLKWK